MGKGGSVSVKEGRQWSEDAPVNTGAVALAGRRFGVRGGTEDADQIAQLGERGSRPPVR